MKFPKLTGHTAAPFTHMYDDGSLNPVSHTRILSILKNNQVIGSI